jgi:6-phosphogluconate dehydrogenase
MQLAIVGLGRMGGNMARRLVRGGHEVIVQNRSPEPVVELEREGATGVHELDGLPAALRAPRVVWLMLPAGAVTEDAVTKLATLLARGDIVVDGGNAFYRDSIRRAEMLGASGIGFLDAGVSGGIWGLSEGYCLMVGGDPEAFAAVEPAFDTLAQPGGYARVGPSGAGHFVKMVHNGIEYGMLQAFGEGFDLLHAAEEFSLDLHAVSEVWRHGSVVRSWLLDLLERALAEDPHLESITGFVDDSGEGRWTVQDAVERGVPATVLAHALFARFTSREHDSFAMQVIAALRKGFGGHAVRER